MGLDIAGNLITGYDGSYNLKINNGTYDCLTIDTSDRSNLPRQPAFIAGYSNAGSWVDFTVSTWNVPPMATTTVNVGSCYNTSTYRFTAPVTGIYFFVGSMYLTNNGNTAVIAYPCFLVNGSLSLRHPNSNEIYRVRGYAQTTSDGQAQEIYYLQADDYVQYAIYANSADCKYYPGYCYFAGVQIG